MQLRIEPPGARRASDGGQGAPPESLVLPFVMQRQELSKWCWAAIASSLGAFYQTRELGQHQVAGHLLGCDCSGFRTDPAAAVRCDVEALLDEALRLVGCYSHWSPGRPTFERLCGEIAAGRPVCLCLTWQTGGAHFAVVSGYHAASREVYVEDPLHGPSVQAYDAFPGQYRGTGANWVGTVWTCPAGRSPVTERA